MLDLARFEAAFAQMRRDKRIMNLSTLSLVAGSSYSHAFHAAQQLGLEYVTEDELIQISYHCAVVLCANRDRDGLVTFEGIGRERKVCMKTVYGLKQIHKTLHVGSLYENERRTLERKFNGLLIGKHDRYCIIVLCATCLKGFGATYEIAEIATSYEIV
jgi:hypothetical protein